MKMRTKYFFLFLILFLVFTETTWAGLPDPEQYYTVDTDVIPNPCELNYSSGDVRIVTITGMDVILEKGHSNGLYELHDQTDIYELNIRADRVIIRSPLHLPQTKITIHARELRFEDLPGTTPTAALCTTPTCLKDRPSPFASGRDGLPGGDVTLFVDQFHTIPEGGERLILAGGKGQPAGLGEDGEDQLVHTETRYIPSFCVIVVNKGSLCECNKDSRIKTTRSDSTGSGNLDAMAAGFPGEGGPGGILSSSFALEKIYDHSGGFPGERGFDSDSTPGIYEGGRDILEHCDIYLDCEIIGWGSWPMVPICSCAIKNTDCTRTVQGYGNDALVPEASHPRGADGTYNPTGHDFSWLHPDAVDMAVMYAEDAIKEGCLQEIKPLLSLYLDRLEQYRCTSDWWLLPQSWRERFGFQEEAIRRLFSETRRTIRVPDDFATIQEALDEAQKGDEIIVSPGTYREQLNIYHKDIILRSTDPLDPSVVSQTIIDGEGRYSVVNFGGTETEQCVLEGFTITGGMGGNGGGINGNGARATIRNNRIVNNEATGAWPTGHVGGGLFACHGLIVNNEIAENRAKDGGGLHSCHGVIRNNHIHHNTAVGVYYSSSGGGGLAYCQGLIVGNEIDHNERSGIRFCNDLIQNNHIHHNTAIDGGAIHDSRAIITDNIIEYNRAVFNGGAIFKGRGMIRNNTIRENQSGSDGGVFYSCEGEILENTIKDNQSSQWGGVFTECDGLIRGNIVIGNKAEYGGAFYKCEGTIERNEIRNNEALSGGGFERCKAIIQNNLISGNTASGIEGRGGGLDKCEGIIQNNTIAENAAYYSGGGISECKGTIRNNLLYFNQAISGGGFSNCTGPIENNTLYSNFAATGGGLFGNPGTVRNCIFRENTAGEAPQLTSPTLCSYCCIQDYTGSRPDLISGDPGFVDPVGRDFQLGEKSPCIDAGDPDPTFNDHSLPPGMGSVRNDMGAYGGPGNSGWNKVPPSPYLVNLTPHGDVWGAECMGVAPFENPERMGWLGFRFDPREGWFPLAGEVNGRDGADLVQVTPHGDVWVSVRDKNIFKPPERWGWLGFRYDEKEGRHPLAGDFNGDGHTDLAEITPYGDVWTALACETSYKPPRRWARIGFSFRRPVSGEGGSLPLAGDANGDGRCDLIQVTPYGDAWVALSSGCGFDPPERWGVPGFCFSPLDGFTVLSGDVNGDNLTDIIQITPTGDPWVALSSGGSFDDPGRRGWLNVFYDETLGYYPLAGDVNADGRIDLVQIAPGGEVYVAISGQGAFEYPEYWGRTGFSYNRDQGYLPLFPAD